MLAINLVVTALMSVSKGESDLNKLASTYQNIEQWQKRVDQTPIGRMGTAEDIAWGCVFLGSDESSFMTGAELVIDGGMTAQ